MQHNQQHQQDQLEQPIPTPTSDPTANTNTHQHACKEVPGSARCVADFFVGASEDKFIGKQTELSCCGWGGHCLVMWISITVIHVMMLTIM
jgi:hypothetical protein